MAEITAALVAQLRRQTGAGMMDCKKALVEKSGNYESAVDLLRKKGQATADKKQGAETREGVIAQHVLPSMRVGTLVEVNCQTDFVAKNESFQAFCAEVARLLTEDPSADLETLRVDQVSKIRENIQISRSQRLEVTGTGMVAAYIHTGGKIGVLVEVGAGQEATLSKDEFKQFVKDVTLQVAAASPLAVAREGLDPAVMAKEKEIDAEQVKGKPEPVVDKIVSDKMEKYFAGVCLLDQGFVKRNSEVSVKEQLAEVAKEVGDSIEIRRFLRFQMGEALA